MMRGRHATAAGALDHDQIIVLPLEAGIVPAPGQSNIPAINAEVAALAACRKRRLLGLYAECTAI